MPKLIVLSEELKGRAFDLTDEKISVGRLSDNSIQLEHDAVSGHHAELTRKGEEYIVRDLNSTNGTRVNGQRVLESRLAHQDIIHFGSLEIQYVSTGATGPKPLPTALKKTVDLTSAKSSTGRPMGYSTTSPFKKGNKGKSKAYLQYALIFLGIVAVALLAFVTYMILNAGPK